MSVWMPVAGIHPITVWICKKGGNLWNSADKLAEAGQAGYSKNRAEDLSRTVRLRKERLSAEERKNIPSTICCCFCSVLVWG